MKQPHVFPALGLFPFFPVTIVLSFLLSIAKPLPHHSIHPLSFLLILAHPLSRDVISLSTFFFLFRKTWPTLGRFSCQTLVASTI